MATARPSAVPTAQQVYAERTCCALSYNWSPTQSAMGSGCGALRRIRSYSAACSTSPAASLDHGLWHSKRRSTRLYRPHIHRRGRHDALQLCLARKPTSFRVLHSADADPSVHPSVQRSIDPPVLSSLSRQSNLGPSTHVRLAHERTVWSALRSCDRRQAAHPKASTALHCSAAVGCAPPPQCATLPAADHSTE